ncbi:MAG: cytochrome c3 family protein [Balneolales bacterium]
MAQIFPKWANNVPKQIQLGLILGLTGIIFGFWYFGSPEYLEVGYAPKQPIPYSHQLHVGQLGIDCRYCHASVEVSAQASIPPTQTCMGCHEMILPDSPNLELLREKWESGDPVEWVRVHDIPDHAYFNHSAHVNVGVGCTSCHGRVDRMQVVMKTESMSMGWCLDCHNNPEPNLRPVEEVTNMAWQPPDEQYELAQMIISKRNIKPPVYCNACHR